MANRATSPQTLATYISQSAEIDRLKSLTIAHLQIKRTLSPLGLCRALGEQPHRTGSNTIRDLPNSVKHALRALVLEKKVEVRRIDRYVTRITLAEVDHG
ncbi:MAG TPA: hypothetical protein V6C84_27265 [Coleofasciculaceae cyanobacterium]|jgi:hypothetical protein